MHNNTHQKVRMLINMIQRCSSFFIFTPSNQMAKDKNSTKNFASSVHVVTAVTVSSPDKESTGRPEPMTASHAG